MISPQLPIMATHRSGNSNFAMVDFGSKNASVSSADHDSSEADLLSETHEMTKYNMYYTTSRLNVRLHRGDSDSPAEYYVKSDCKLTSIALQVRRGGSKQSPAVAFAKSNKSSRHMLLGRGENRDAGPDDYEELHRDRNIFLQSDYHFAISHPDQTRTTYTWRKDKSKSAKTVYDCVDDGTGAVMARLLSGGAFNINKGGELLVSDALVTDTRELIIASAMGVWFTEAFQYHSLLQGFDGSEDKGKKSV